MIQKAVQDAVMLEDEEEERQRQEIEMNWFNCKGCAGLVDHDHRELSCDQVS